ncbi:hypothetical protein BDP81DRAFT_394017 [Colletotrichum phormii]|uniref:Uncharacterized protein n=1 Tax=Colletotrichum phormii TaxID=359342 RepID=A0AAJ0EHW2_9PEZI|nr:uncharacterized protein BDP81DRAFT_394017 [Colletotrichum phormii]KAK1637345.1 hypothetical protein BDP81DRAFT_394017 [Colletotrichum phormii]
MAQEDCLPDKVNGEQLPACPVQQPTKYPDDLTSKEMTAYLLANTTFHKLVDLRTQDVVPLCWVRLNPKISKKGRQIPPDIATTVYGTVQPATTSYSRYKAGKGIFADYITFTGHSCNSCQYISTAYECSLRTGTVTTSRPTPTKYRGQIFWKKSVTQRKAWKPSESVISPLK